MVMMTQLQDYRFFLLQEGISFSVKQFVIYLYGKVELVFGSSIIVNDFSRSFSPSGFCYCFIGIFCEGIMKLVSSNFVSTNITSMSSC